MRIARFTTGEEPQFGIVHGGDDDLAIAAVVGDPLYAGVELTGQQVRLDDVRLLAPVIPRSKVVGVGRNYVDHAAELGHDVPAEPLIFLKPNTAVIGPDDPIVYPQLTKELHFEGELAVVIGRICRDVPRERVGDVIYGYTCANDVTARDLQESDGQWARAKGFDTFCPLGPWIETELDASDVRVTTTLNGEPQQDASTKQMVFDVASLVEHITAFTTLLPGDVILTGTPSGVGPMEPGDRVQVEVAGIGSLSNPVVARD